MTLFRRNQFDALVKILFIRLIAVNIFLSLRQSTEVFKRMNDMGSDKNDHIALFIMFFRLAKQRTDERKAS